MNTKKTCTIANRFDYSKAEKCIVVPLRCERKEKKKVSKRGKWENLGLRNEP